MKSGLPALLDVRIYYNARYRDHYHRGGTLWDWVYQGEFRASVLFRASVGGAGAHVGGKRPVVVVSCGGVFLGSGY